MSIRTWWTRRHTPPPIIVVIDADPRPVIFPHTGGDIIYTPADMKPVCIQINPQCDVRG